jgi:hypothetical protein
VHKPVFKLSLNAPRRRTENQFGAPSKLLEENYGLFAVSSIFSPEISRFSDEIAKK